MNAASQGAQLPRPGDMIAGKYVLDRLLGQGGMGAVFAARHLKLSKAVAIKIMLADASNPEAAQRFINEGRAAANIQNEHVVRVDDVDEEMGYAYMVLELLDGEDLAQVLEREPTHKLAPHVVVGYVLQALRGVAQAHAIGIVHRDLKPSNLFLARRKDGSVVVKVLDFGISKAQGSSALAASPSALTSTKAMLGSPLYMSPEQLRSSKSVDHRADIWAIGIILYELITGSLPFMGENLGELFAAILETDPAPLRTRAENVPPGLEEVVMRCLARKPEQRWSTAMDLANALAPFAQQGGVYPLASTVAMNPALGGTALLGPGAITPNPISSGAPGGPLGTGTGSGPRPVGAAFQQTGSGGGWQSTGSAVRPAPVLPKGPPIGLIAGIAGAVAIAAIVVTVVVVKGGKKTDPTTANTAATSALASTPPPASASAPPPPTDTIPPPTSATASVSVPPAVTAAPTTKPTHHPLPSPVTKPTETTKPADPTPPAPHPSPTPTKKPGDNTQNTR